MNCEFDPYDLDETAVYVLLQNVNDIALRAKQFKYASDFMKYVGFTLKDKKMNNEDKIKRIKTLLKCTHDNVNRETL